MWRKTLQSGYSKERGVWGRYKVINCGWAWNHDCSQGPVAQGRCTDFAIGPLKITFSGGGRAPQRTSFWAPVNRWALKLSSISRDVNAMAETEKQIKTISVAVVPSRQKIFVQPKLRHNNVHLIRYTCSTRLWDSLYECLAKEMCLFSRFKQRECVWTPNVIRKAVPEFGSQIWKSSTSFSGLCYPRYYQESRVLWP